MEELQEKRPMTYAERRVTRHLCEKSHLAFTRYFFYHREGQKFIVAPHHIVMTDTLDKVFSGEIKRLIINVPPGYTKTELAVINFIAHGLAINPASKFIHISYSDNLAMLNSTLARDVVFGEEFQELWKVDLRDDSKAKKSWVTGENGGMMAVSSGGSVTGFRAGRMMEGFSGAFIVDDPIKPDDAYSSIMREKINNRFTNTFKSRLAREVVPIIVIMQRIHEDDTTGFLLKGGTAEKWHHLLLPSITAEAKEPYPKEYTHGIPIDCSLPVGPLWDHKHTLEELQMIESSDPYTYSSQYEQRPAPLGGGIFKGDWWKFYDVTPQFEYKIITGDTAQKTKEIHDWSVFQCWGVEKGKIYLIDQIRGKWEAPQLKIQFTAFWNKHFGVGNELTGRLRSAYIEDKASGTGLIQDIRQDEKNPIPIIPVQRNTDKITRAMDMAPFICSGYVYLPSGAEFLSEYMAEFSKFTPTMTHKHDDQIDPTLDAIGILLRPANLESGIW